MAEIDIREFLVTAETVADYCTVPMEFRVESRYNPKAIIGDTKNWQLELEAIEPYLKNYDEHEDPRQWTIQFNTVKWNMLSAMDGDERIGGCIIACNTQGVDMLEGRSDLAVLWDIRIHPDFRNSGIGSHLCTSAIEWSRKQGCTEMKVETQDINVAACKFYQKMGFALRAVRQGAYPEIPNEIQLLWYREL